MKFKYQGFDRAARKISGELEAENEQDAVQRLRASAIRPTRIVSIAGGAPKAAPTGGRELRVVKGKTLGGMMNSDKPSLTEFTAFIRQLATMQEAGVPIVQALNVLGEQAENRGFGAVVSKVARKIEEGTNLTDALRRHGDIFDNIFINLIQAGEVAGALDKVLLRLAIYYEKANSLRRKIVSAMTYPVMIIVLVTGILIGLLMFVVPQFVELFASNGKALPAPTQFIIDVSNWMREHWYLVFGSVGGGAYGIYFAFTNEAARRQIDPFLLTIPVFGPLFMKIAIARFSRTLGTMIQSGVPIIEALDITAKVAGNYAIETAINRTRVSITEGNSIAGPLQRAKVFPQMAVSMIAIGEQTGSLDQMLSKIAEFYEDEIDATVSALTSILEPLMIIFVGLVVAGILVPLYLPVMKMGEVAGG